MSPHRLIRIPPFFFLLIRRISERAQALGDDHPTLGPKQIYEYLSNLMYARRSKMDPLWNSMLLGGVKDGER